MCGFVGFVARAGGPPAGSARIADLLARLAHRGPDGSGVVQGPRVVLAAVRLAIQGPLEAQQPRVSPSGRLALAWNGEVLASARRALRDALSGRGVEPPPSAEGDTALLLCAASAALEGGEGWEGPCGRALCEAVLGGMGALCVADLAAGKAWLLRDRFGIKPLYTREDPEGLGTWWASELEPLLRVAPARLDLRGLASLVHLHRPGPRLPWQGVRSVPARHLQELGPLGPQAPVPAGPDPLLVVRLPGHEAARARRELAAALASTAREAVQAPGRVTLLLSGGLDSAAVAAAAGRSDLHALTGRFAPWGGALDESREAAEVAAQAGVRHEVADLDDAGLLEDLPAVVRALELPLGGPGSLALWRLMARVRGRGRVLLTGTGGDEFLGGYARVALALGRAGPWTAGYEALWARVAGLPTVAARVQALHDRSGDVAPLLAPAFRAALGEPELACAGPAGEQGLALALRAEVEGTLAALLQVEDRLAGAHGLEARPVFCLGRLPGAALALPEEEVVGPDGEGKRALRTLLRGRIPEGVRTARAKRGFPTPFERAARGVGRERLEQLFGDERFAARGWWDVAACRARLDEQRPVHDRGLFACVVLETWARLYLDGDAHALPPRGAALPRSDA